MTKNIPSKLPIQCDEDTEDQILSWIASRPVAEMDDAMGALCRWRYEVEDHGILTWIGVIDTTDNSRFSPEFIPEEW
jgi:hypothetical protein